jgi:hypothetical protein
LSGFLTRPAFNPPQPPTQLGANGTVLTVVGGGLKFTTAGSSGISFGQFIAFTLVGAGPFNDVSPTGFNALTGRLDLSNSGASVNVTGLVAGADGQGIILRNAGASFNITLQSQNAGSLAANRFVISADITLTPLNAVLAVYYAGSINRWVIKT